MPPDSAAFRSTWAAEGGFPKDGCRVLAVRAAKDVPAPARNTFASKMVGWNNLRPLWT